MSFREIDEENPENMRIEDKYWRKLSVKWTISLCEVENRSTVPEPEPPCSSWTTGSSGLEIEMGSPWSRTDGAAGTRFRPLPQLPSILHFRQQQLRLAWWWRRECPLRRWSNWSGWGSWGKAFFWTCKGETWSCLPARQVNLLMKVPHTLKEPSARVKCLSVQLVLRRRRCPFLIRWPLSPRRQLHMQLCTRPLPVTHARSQAAVHAHTHAAPHPPADSSLILHPMKLRRTSNKSRWDTTVCLHGSVRCWWLMSTFLNAYVYK